MLMCNIHKLEGFNKRMGNLIKKACCSQFLNAYATWTCRSMEFGMHLNFFFFFLGYGEVRKMYIEKATLCKMTTKQSKKLQGREEKINK